MQWVTGGAVGSVAQTLDALATLLARYVILPDPTRRGGGRVGADHLVPPRVSRVPVPVHPLGGEAVRQEPAARAPGPCHRQRLTGDRPSHGSAPLSNGGPHGRRAAVRRGGIAPRPARPL